MTKHAKPAPKSTPANPRSHAPKLDAPNSPRPQAPTPGNVEPGSEPDRNLNRDPKPTAHDADIIGARRLHEGDPLGRPADKGNVVVPPSTEFPVPEGRVVAPGMGEVSAQGENQLQTHQAAHTKVVGMAVAPTNHDTAGHLSAEQVAGLEELSGDGFVVQPNRDGCTECGAERDQTGHLEHAPGCGRRGTQSLIEGSGDDVDFVLRVLGVNPAKYVQGGKVDRQMLADDVANYRTLFAGRVTAGSFVE
jgi:hypothetical protein